MKNDVAIVIPIKTRNSRLPGKNTKLLGNKPLYSYLFETVKETKYIDKIYLDTSDKSIKEIASKWDFSIINRPEKFNSDSTSGHDLLNFEFQYIKEKIIGQLFVTNPFLLSTTIDKAAKMLIENNSIDSVFGVYPIYNRFWFKERPVNHNPAKLVGTQYMEPAYCESGWYFMRKDAFLNEQARITNRHKYIVTTEKESSDIDTLEDFIRAESLLKEER